MDSNCGQWLTLYAAFSGARVSYCRREAEDSESVSFVNERERRSEDQPGTKN